MSARGTERAEVGLETVISYVLIAGVLLSLLLEVAGVLLYYLTAHSLAISESPALRVQGHDFFSYLWGLLRGGLGGSAAVQLMTAGIVVLLLTPFLRVVFSVLFFAWERNYKFVLITLFVLVVLTVSLTLH